MVNKNKGVANSDGSGSKILARGRVRSGQFFVGRLESAIFGLGLGLENFP